MNKRNLKTIHEFITRKGNDIQALLPPLLSHPYRQAQTHLYTEIKHHFGVPVKEIGDGRFDEVMKLLQICVEHAAEPSVSKYLTWVVKEPERATLDNFFENN